MLPLDESMDPEDLLSDSLQMLYDYQPITLTTTSGAPFTYTLHKCEHQHSEPLSNCKKAISISLRTPDTAAANWALQASSIWTSSIYLADHLDELHLIDQIHSAPPQNPCRILELGASAGLPSILIAKRYPMTMVTATDYPDDALIQALSENVQRNGVAQSCRVLPFAWGSDPTLILYDMDGKYDAIVAADTLWNSDLHEIFIHSLRSTLKKASTSRIYLIVGLHTGRYTIGSFLKRVSQSGFDLDTIEEREVRGDVRRNWDVDRANEDDQERRRWIILIQLKWGEVALEL